MIFCKEMGTEIPPLVTLLIINCHYKHTKSTFPLPLLMHKAVSCILVKTRPNNDDELDFVCDKHAPEGKYCLWLIVLRID